eukprot:scaffold39838_cov70-Phaeocystis_antarctica.AAC.13
MLPRRRKVAPRGLNIRSTSWRCIASVAASRCDASTPTTTKTSPSATWSSRVRVISELKACPLSNVM